jgi:MFS family permease
MATNVLSRIPLAAIDVVLIVHVHALRGSWAVAGLIGGLHGLSSAAAAPLLGAAVDRRGQTVVLTTTGPTCGTAIVALALVPAAAPVAVLGALAVAAGTTTPPLGACLRALWPSVLGDDPRALQAAYALESAVLELTFITGPAAFLALAAVSSRAAIAALGGLLGAGTLAFAAEPVSRRWRPHDGAKRTPGAALRSGGVRTLVAVMGLLGMLLGAVEVAIAAAMTAAHSPGATGPLLALWGVGSLLGGLAAARAARPPHARELALLLLALGAGHAALAAGGTPIALGALLVLAGAGVAPLFAAANTLASRLAVPGTSTEAFAWLNTAVAGGVALGALLGGTLADSGGATAAFLASGAAAAVAALTVTARAPSLQPA